MTNERILQLIKIERECVKRNGKCDRDCANCDLVQIDSDLIEMYDNAIRLYQKIVEGRVVVCEGWQRDSENEDYLPFSLGDAYRSLGV